VRTSSLLGLAAALCALLLAGCGGGKSEEPAGGDLDVIATTTIWGDLVRNATCADASVETLLSVGEDPHSIELSARQAAELRNATLVVANGLDLEEAFTDVLLDARDSGTAVLFVAEELDPIPFGMSGSNESSDRVTALDPHVWMDPLRVAEGVRLIAAELSARTETDHTACAEAYVARLEALDREIAGLLESVPAQSRNLVTNHDALGYFAARYGFVVVDTVIPGGATLAEPSAGDIVDLVERIDSAGVRAIFTDETSSAELARLVADETTHRVEIVPLFSGSLGHAGSGAETYVGMLRTNAERVADALSR